MEHYHEIREYLTKKTYPKRMKLEWQKRNFRRDCSNFLVQKGILFRKGTGTNLRALGERELDEVLESIHSLPHGGHLGINKTYKKIKERYFIKGLFEKVKKYVENCDVCQRKASLKKTKKPLHPIQVPDAAFSKIGMDLIGPLEETKDGNKYIVVYTEYLTKWVDAEAVPNKNAATIINSLVKFVCTHGIPDTLITDQGREFCNELNKLFCEKMGICHKVASPYHPQTGGQTERFNRTLSNMLVSFVNKTCDDWDLKLPYVLFAYRTAEHSTTKKEPFFLVYGRKARLPVELQLPTTSSTQDDLNNQENLNKRVNMFLKLTECRQYAAENIKKEQKKQKMYYDSKIKPSQFKVGDQVLLHNTRKLTRKGGKLNPLWSGPYTIQEVLKSGCYRLNGQSVAVNGCRLKEYKFKHETNQDTDQRSSNMAYTGEKKMKSNNSTKYGRNDYISRKQKDVKDSEQNVVSNDRSTVTDSPILPNETSSPKKDEDQNYAYWSEKVNATRSAGKREKEPEVTIKSPQEDSKLRSKIGGQNNPDDETFLPPKKRKNSRGVGNEYEANDVRILHVEAETSIVFDPPSENWQKEKSRFFGLKVKNYHKTVPTRQVSINARPAKHAQMRGDGNCLFRTFSYIIFGVQTHYAEIRQKVIEYMTKNRRIFEQYTNETLTNYLNQTQMWEDGKWGTDVEIRAVASMLNTNVYVYCTYGTEQNCSWNKYTPINSASESSMYILHRNDHYEPVLDVEDCEFQDLFSRPPYLPIRKYVPEKYWKYVSAQTLEAALVNNYNDEKILQEMRECPDTIYVQKYKDAHYNIPGTEDAVKEFDPNVFNLLCDHENFVDLLF